MKTAHQSCAPPQLSNVFITKKKKKKATLISKIPHSSCLFLTEVFRSERFCSLFSPHLSDLVNFNPPFFFLPFVDCAGHYWNELAEFPFINQIHALLVDHPQKTSVPVSSLMLFKMCVLGGCRYLQFEQLILKI